MNVPQHIETFWRSFLDSQSNPMSANERFCESFRIGSDDEDADEGARLILSGEKTATSSLLWEYENRGKPLPKVGALSVVEDGGRKPTCVVQTTWIEVVPFSEVDAKFAREYGESDGTLEGWCKMFWEYYSDACKVMGCKMSKETPLVCERFQVIFPFRPPATDITRRCS